MRKNAIGHGGDLRIHTSDRRIENQIFEGQDSVSPTDGLTLQSQGMSLRKDALSGATLEIAVSVGGGVAADIAVRWLWDRVKDTDATIETPKGKYDSTKEGIEEAWEDLLDEKE